MNNQKIEPVIKANSLTKRLSSSSSEELLIIDQIDLSIHQGESVAIIGASGSGKTTLLGLLAGLDIASDGDVNLLGQNLSSLDEDQRAALRLGKVGFVFQSFHLMENLTALENVMLPLELENNSNTSDTHLKLSFKEIRQRATEALKQVGLDKRTTHLPTQLSGGEQQRVALARAFVSQPSILFADEPTGNLDRNTGEEIISLLFEMQQQSDTTLVMGTHDDSLANRCQTQNRLLDGQLAE